MSLEIYVEGYSGYSADERPLQFTIDEQTFQIEAVEDQWCSPDAAFFKVRTRDGKHYLLRYNERQDQWTIQSDFDRFELFSRPRIESITVETKAIREAESRIAVCERCRPGESEVLFDWILAVYWINMVRSNSF